MSEFSLQDVVDAKDKATEQTKRLVPWLDDPHVCDECGAYCDATVDYVAQQADYMDVWECPECEARYFRNRD